jgi:hypothetical protein
MTMSLSTQKAIEHMRHLVTELSAILFDDEYYGEQEWDDEGEPVLVGEGYGSLQRAFKRGSAGGGFSFLLDYTTDWASALNYAETEAAQQAEALFWLVAQSLPGWEADMMSAAEVRWLRVKER